MKVTYYGHVGTPSGYGVAAEHTCRAMLAAGIDLEIVPLTPPDRSRVREACVPLAPYIVDPMNLAESRDLVIVHTLPMDCERIRELHEAAVGRVRESMDLAVAYTTWETLAPPKGVVAALRGFDQAWVPSSVLKRNSDREVEVVPHTFDDTVDRKPVGRFVDGDDEGPFSFYYVGAWSSRKNVHGLVRAFCSAFTAADDVELVLHTGANVNMLAGSLASTGIPQNELPRVRLTPEQMSPVQMEGWVASMDCFVTATRGEAWNLPAFEALLAGRMIISPANLGSDDFLLDTTETILLGRGGGSEVSLPYVDVTPLPNNLMGVGGAQGMTCRDRWYEPNLVSLADSMRYVYEAKKRDNRTKYDLGERFGYAAVGKLIREKLEGLLNA